MRDKLCHSLDSIRAEEELKAKTLAYLREQTGDYGRARSGKSSALVWAGAVVCLALVLTLGGLWGYIAYTTPVSLISVDVNPSFQMELNRFGRVLSFAACNEDAQPIARELRLENMPYAQALELLLAREELAPYLEDESGVTVTVAGPDEETSTQLLTGVTACTQGMGKVSCAAGNKEEAAAAREIGLPYGKYRVFVQLQELEPAITPEEAQGLTMRELRDRLTAAQNGEKPQAPESSALEKEQEPVASESPGYGQEQGETHGKGNGQGNGSGQGNGFGYGKNHGDGPGRGQGKGAGKRR